MMIFEQYELGCLSLFSYLVADETTGQAVVVDPQRDISRYLADAERLGVQIERVIETHFHADFLSGHLELAAATGAVISYGDVARPDFAFEPLAHGQVLSLGEVTLEIRHTPGHTPESISIVVREHPTGPPWAVLTGDTLFIGDVGRPDLLTSVGVSADDLARRLHRSLHEQLMTLPDETRVFPAHGAGSACGKNLSTSTSSTIGEQRATNYALAPMSVDQFVEAVTQDQSVAPLYFAFAANANRRDRELLDEAEDPPIVDLDDAVDQQAQGVVVIDARPVDQFASGHLRGSVNVGLDGRFAEYAGDVLRPGQSVLLVTEPGFEREARVRLARIGFDHVIGTVADLTTQLAPRPELVAVAPRVTASELESWIVSEPDLQIIDVRNPGERIAGSIDGSISLPLPTLLDRIGELDPARPTLVYCAGGYRSAAAASLLRHTGFHQVAELAGGYAATLTRAPQASG
jgi:glyoxylase-like metal-dependent hydrolase (beta-lactamase superfamily II)